MDNIRLARGPGLETGRYDFIPFTLYMPSLFESFVAEWLDEHLPREYRIKKQYRAHLDSERRFVFQIDLVLTDSTGNEILAVLDTKYKHKEEPESDDIGQIIAYAVRMGTNHGILVYPSITVSPVQLKAGQIEIRSMTFNVGTDIDEAGYIFLHNLLETIM